MAKIFKNSINASLDMLINIFSLLWCRFLKIIKIQFNQKCSCLCFQNDKYLSHWGHFLKENPPVKFWWLILYEIKKHHISMQKTQNIFDFCTPYVISQFVRAKTHSTATINTLPYENNSIAIYNVLLGKLIVPTLV